MQNTSKNSNVNAGGANDLTNNPGNGLIIDAEKLFTFTPEQCLSLNKRPNSSVYKVLTDKMREAHKDAIFENDDLTAEPVAIDHIKTGKLYLVEDNKGNIYLGNAKDNVTGKSLTLNVLNPLYQPTVIPIEEIKYVSLVYSLGRQMMSDEELAELVRLEREFESFGKGGNHE